MANAKTGPWWCLRRSGRSSPSGTGPSARNQQLHGDVGTNEPQQATRWREADVVRKFAMVLLGAGMLLVTAMPVQAKEGEGAEVDGVTVAVVGPGLRGPIVIGGQNAVAFDDQILTFQDMAKMTLRPTVALGPRYQVLLTIRCLVPTGYTTATIHEVLYPYATSGPWAFTGAGQSTCLGSVPAGWISAQSGTFAFLMAHGLPSTPPPAIAAP